MGLPGVRAIGLLLSSGRAQVSTNVHDPLAAPLGGVVERCGALAAPLGARPVEAELVGLVPAAALVGYPEDVPIRGFDPERHVIERRLAPPADRLNSRHGPDQEEAPPQAPRHPGRPDRHRRRRSRPRSREEAKARARSGRSRAARRKRDLPPTWRKAPPCAAPPPR